MDKIISDKEVIEILNSVLSSHLFNGKALILRKYTPKDEGFPICNIISITNTIDSFDEGTIRGIQNVEVQVVCHNVGRNDEDISKIINIIYNAVHQKLDDIERVAGGNWKFYSVLCSQLATNQIYDNKGDNPGTTGSIGISMKLEYIGR